MFPVPGHAWTGDAGLQYFHDNTSVSGIHVHQPPAHPYLQTEDSQNWRAVLSAAQAARIERDQRLSLLTQQRQAPHNQSPSLHQPLNELLTQNPNGGHKFSALLPNPTRAPVPRPSLPASQPLSDKQPNLLFSENYSPTKGTHHSSGPRKQLFPTASDMQPTVRDHTTLHVVPDPSQPKRAPLQRQAAIYHEHTIQQPPPMTTADNVTKSQRTTSTHTSGTAATLDSSAGPSAEAPAGAQNSTPPATVTAPSQPPFAAFGLLLLSSPVALSPTRGPRGPLLSPSIGGDAGAVAKQQGQCGMDASPQSRPSRTKGRGPSPATNDHTHTARSTTSNSRSNSAVSRANSHSHDSRSGSSSGSGKRLSASAHRPHPHASACSSPPKTQLSHASGSPPATRRSDGRVLSTTAPWPRRRRSYSVVYVSDAEPPCGEGSSAGLNSAATGPAGVAGSADPASNVTEEHKGADFGARSARALGGVAADGRGLAAACGSLEEVQPPGVPGSVCRSPGASSGSSRGTFGVAQGTETVPRSRSTTPPSRGTDPGTKSPRPHVGSPLSLREAPNDGGVVALGTCRLSRDNATEQSKWHHPHAPVLRNPLPTTARQGNPLAFASPTAASSSASKHRHDATAASSPSFLVLSSSEAQHHHVQIGTQAARAAKKAASARSKEGPIGGQLTEPDLATAVITAGVSAAAASHSAGLHGVRHDGPLATVARAAWAATVPPPALATAPATGPAEDSQRHGVSAPHKADGVHQQPPQHRQLRQRQSDQKGHGALQVQRAGGYGIEGEGVQEVGSAGRSKSFQQQGRQQQQQPPRGRGSSGASSELIGEGDAEEDEDDDEDEDGRQAAQLKGGSDGVGGVDDSDWAHGGGRSAASRSSSPICAPGAAAARGSSPSRVRSTGQRRLLTVLLESGVVTCSPRSRNGIEGYSSNSEEEAAACQQQARQLLPIKTRSPDRAQPVRFRATDLRPSLPLKPESEPRNQRDAESSTRGDIESADVPLMRVAAAPHRHVRPVAEREIIKVGGVPSGGEPKDLTAALGGGGGRHRGALPVPQNGITAPCSRLEATQHTHASKARAKASNEAEVKTRRRAHPSQRLAETQHADKADREEGLRQRCVNMGTQEQCRQESRAVMRALRHSPTARVAVIQPLPRPRMKHGCRNGEHNVQCADPSDSDMDEKNTRGAIDLHRPQQRGRHPDRALGSAGLPNQLRRASVRAGPASPTSSTDTDPWYWLVKAGMADYLSCAGTRALLPVAFSSSSSSPPSPPRVHTSCRSSTTSSSCGYTMQRRHVSGARLHISPAQQHRLPLASGADPAPGAAASGPAWLAPRRLWRAPSPSSLPDDTTTGTNGIRLRPVEGDGGARRKARPGGPRSQEGVSRVCREGGGRCGADHVGGARSVSAPKPRCGGEAAAADEMPHGVKGTDCGGGSRRGGERGDVARRKRHVDGACGSRRGHHHRSRRPDAPNEAKPESARQPLKRRSSEPQRASDQAGHHGATPHPSPDGTCVGKVRIRVENTTKASCSAAPVDTSVAVDASARQQLPRPEVDSVPSPAGAPPQPNIPPEPKGEVSGGPCCSPDLNVQSRRRDAGEAGKGLAAAAAGQAENGRQPVATCVGAAAWPRMVGSNIVDASSQDGAALEVKTTSEASGYGRIAPALQQGPTTSAPVPLAVRKTTAAASQSGGVAAAAAAAGIYIAQVQHTAAGAAATTEAQLVLGIDAAADCNKEGARADGRVGGVPSGGSGATLQGADAHGPLRLQISEPHNDKNAADRQGSGAMGARTGTLPFPQAPTNYRVVYSAAVEDNVRENVGDDERHAVASMPRDAPLMAQKRTDISLQPALVGTAADRRTLTANPDFGVRAGSSGGHGSVPLGSIATLPQPKVDWLGWAGASRGQQQLAAVTRVEVAAGNSGRPAMVPFPSLTERGEQSAAPVRTAASASVAMPGSSRLGGVSRAGSQTTSDDGAAVKSSLTAAAVGTAPPAPPVQVFITGPTTFVAAPDTIPSLTTNPTIPSGNPLLLQHHHHPAQQLHQHQHQPVLLDLRPFLNPDWAQTAGQVACIPTRAVASTATSDGAAKLVHAAMHRDHSEAHRTASARSSGDGSRSARNVGLKGRGPNAAHQTVGLHAKAAAVSSQPQSFQDIMYDRRQEHQQHQQQQHQQQQLRTASDDTRSVAFLTGLPQPMTTAASFKAASALERKAPDIEREQYGSRLIIARYRSSSGGGSSVGRPENQPTLLRPALRDDGPSYRPGSSNTGAARSLHSSTRGGPWPLEAGRSTVAVIPLGGGSDVEVTVRLNSVPAGGTARPHAYAGERLVPLVERQLVLPGHSHKTDEEAWRQQGSRLARKRESPPQPSTANQQNMHAPSLAHQPWHPQVPQISLGRDMQPAYTVSSNTRQPAASVPTPATAPHQRVMPPSLGHATAPKAILQDYHQNGHQGTGAAGFVREHGRAVTQPGAAGGPAGEFRTGGYGGRGASAAGRAAEGAADLQRLMGHMTSGGRLGGGVGGVGGVGNEVQVDLSHGKFMQYARGRVLGP